MPTIKAVSLGVSLRGQSIFSGASFSLSRGEGLRVRGPNGSGKTLLLKTFAGLIRPQEGILSIQKDLAPTRFCPFNSSMDDFLKAGEFLRMWGNKTGLEREITQWSLGELLGQPMGRLSAGQRKRVMLAQTFSHKAKLWLLDEPEVALDDHNLQILEEKLNGMIASGSTPVVATHRTGFLEQDAWTTLDLGQAR